MLTPIPPTVPTSIPPSPVCLLGGHIFQFGYCGLGPMGHHWLGHLHILHICHYTYAHTSSYSAICWKSSPSHSSLCLLLLTPPLPFVSLLFHFHYLGLGVCPVSIPGIALLFCIVQVREIDPHPVFTLFQHCSSHILWALRPLHTRPIGFEPLPALLLILGSGTTSVHVLCLELLLLHAQSRIQTQFLEPANAGYGLC